MSKKTTATRSTSRNVSNAKGRELAMLIESSDHMDPKRLASLADTFVLLGNALKRRATMSPKQRRADTAAMRRALGVL